MTSKQIEALLLDIELLLVISLEQDSLRRNSSSETPIREKLTDSNIKELVFAKEMAKSHREMVSMQTINSEDLKKSMMELRRRLMALKFIPHRFEPIITDAIFKSSRCIESI